ncbi:MAG: DUF2877 domain-containing protein [Candidatus Hydrogenedentota bacterium]|uniref:DUF2877 domain-containing protein n=1 Tax=Sumerlaea chitinivorans TaxID=2250252 RepID=A0A2Z4Y7D5_SUMC1|nr:hypothetical protein BRCON_2387 [Candidatus Sumerlaea chitinivorans]MCX7963930.1 DUF2877 domain-containing protein [Candidatus Sumerlaea chitinivorans]RMH27033.1 MAG: DUF2877 domain-containing protein [Candidatus Hydrogenedentota bacterium]GIX43951.1 MAG: hypothetical protein KatS3mg130_0359 [Candidatus Sumerlaea sp.]
MSKGATEIPNLRIGDLALQALRSARRGCLMASTTSGVFLELDTGLILALLAGGTPLHPWAVSGILPVQWEELRALTPSRTKTNILAPRSRTKASPNVTFEVTPVALKGPGVELIYAKAVVVGLRMPRWGPSMEGSDSSQEAPTPTEVRPAKTHKRAPLRATLRKLVSTHSRQASHKSGAVQASDHALLVAATTLQAEVSKAAPSGSELLGAGSLRDALHMIRTQGDPRPLAALLGGGEGLTPAADDVILGVLAACEMLSDFEPTVRRFRQELVAQMPTPLRQYTTRFSAQLIEAAIAGHFPEPLLDIAHAICAPQFSEAQLVEATKRLLAVGHSSGLLWLSGFSEIFSTSLR